MLTTRNKQDKQMRIERLTIYSGLLMAIESQRETRGHNLNDRQGKALGYLLQNSKLTIQDFEDICPQVNRRSLQRDLKGMLDTELIVEIGGPTDPTRHYTFFEL